MKDRYLFKAKRTDNGEWVKGYLFDDGFENGRIFIGGLVIEKYNGTACDEWNVTGIDFYEVDPSTVCQCAGLKDETGKLIWENDIIRTKVGTAKVIWDKSEWRIEWLKNDLWRKDLYYWAVENIQRVVVIGNIFNNPESLESEKK